MAYSAVPESSAAVIEPGSEHGLETVYWDEGDGDDDGWRAECKCGWETDAWSLLEMAGREIDAHWRQHSWIP